MPNTNWSELSHLQLGRYAEYYAKMEFASYGYDVYTSEVDDHGVDFVARNPDDDQYYEIQVKAVRNLDYVYIRKDKEARRQPVCPSSAAVSFRSGDARYTALYA